MLSQTAILIYASFALSRQAYMTNKKEGEISSSSFEPAEGFGPPTPRLQITCSTAELRRRAIPFVCECKDTTFFSFYANFFVIFYFFLIMCFNNMIQLSGDIFKQSIITRKINLLHLYKFYGML